MSERYAFIDSTQKFFDQAKTEDQRQMVREAIKNSLMENLTKSMDDMVSRALESSSMGMLDVTNTKLAGLLHHSIVCYTFGFYYATIAMCGITAERLCIDLLLQHRLALDGKQLQYSELAPLFEIPHRRLIALLVSWNVIETDIKSKLYQINDKRNEYIHPDKIPDILFRSDEGTVKRDALKVLNLLKEVASKSFPFVSS